MEDSNKPPFNPALEELSRYLRDFSSNTEIVLWNRLKDNQLGCEFTWQHPIGDYVVTFFCEEKKLAIDVESEAHTHPDAYFAAVKKQEDLKELGIRVLRVREEDVLADAESVINGLSAILKDTNMKLNLFAKDIFTVDEFWTKQECEDFIVKSEAFGYEPATVSTEKGQIIVENVRNNNRVIYTDFTLADKIWQRLKVFAPTKIGNSKAVGLNELFRFYKYQAGQQFKRHHDQSFIRNEIEASYYTFMIYLNDNYEGGETTFNNLVVKPKQGTALVFFHDIEHEGTLVKQGIKYVLRTDIMFRLQEEA